MTIGNPKKEINVYEKIRALEDEPKELRKMADSAYSEKKRLSDFTWGEIAEIAKGHPEDVFDIGDEKEIPLSSGEVLTAVIVGFKHDNLAIEHGVAGITFGMKGIPDGWFEMNTDCANVSGWKDCKMRNVYMQRFYNIFPKKLKDLIVTIVKRTGNGDGKDAIIETEDKLFLFSEVEVFGAAERSVCGEGTQYDYFKSKDNRIKCRNGYASATSWWLRSPYALDSSRFCGVSAIGYVSYNVASGASGVCFGFCL